MARAEAMKASSTSSSRQRHVGAVGAVEDHRRDAFVLDRQQHQRGQPLRVGGDALDRHALARQLLADEAAHLLVADAGDQRRLRPSRAVPMAMLAGQPPTDLAKERDILQPRADLLAVEIDRGAADGDDVERAVCACSCRHGILPRCSTCCSLIVLESPELKHKFHLTVNVEYLFYLQNPAHFREGNGHDFDRAARRRPHRPDPRQEHRRVAAREAGGDRRSVAGRRQRAVGGDRRAGPRRPRRSSPTRRSTRC